MSERFDPQAADALSVKGGVKARVAVLAEVWAKTAAAYHTDGTLAQASSLR